MWWWWWRPGGADCLWQLVSCVLCRCADENTYRSYFIEVCVYVILLRMCASDVTEFSFGASTRSSGYCSFAGRVRQSPRRKGRDGDEVWPGNAPQYTESAEAKREFREPRNF